MIHAYSLFDTNIVLDVNSGAVHVFDEVSFRALTVYNELKNSGHLYTENECIKKEVHYELSDKYSYDETAEALDEIMYLEREGLLFSPDQLSAYRLDFEEHVPLKALCLHVSHDCNLECEYCFASKGDFGLGKKLMPRDTAFKAIDFLISNSLGRNNLEVDFFGGEPLMNLEVVYDTVEYARSIEKKHNKNFRFTITTNGVLLNEDIMDYFNKEFDNVVFSLDGTRQTHDRMRKFKNGAGSYSVVLSNIKTAAAKRADLDHFVRGTYTAYNINFSKDVLHLADTGFKHISVEPVVTSPDNGYALTEEMLPQIFREYERLAMECAKRKEAGRGFNFFHFQIDLDQGPCAVKSLKGCGAGYEYLAVTPEGDIYPCHQFVGNKDFFMGNIHREHMPEPRVGKMFKSINIATKQCCRDCWAKFYCSGGCAASSYFASGSLDKPYELGCLLEKKRLECAIWLRAVLTC